MSILLKHYWLREDGGLSAGADPGINYEGRVGVHKSMNIIMKKERVHKSIALYNEVHQGGCTCLLCPPLDPLLKCGRADRGNGRMLH